MNLITHNSLKNKPLHLNNFCNKPCIILLSRSFHTKSFNYMTYPNQSSHKQTLKTSSQKRSSCLTKSTRKKTSLAAQVTILTSKSQFFIINVNKLDCRQMFISMMPLSCFLVKLKRVIMPIGVILLSLTNFVLICSCFLRPLSGNLLT